MTILAAETYGGTSGGALDTACAVEMIHTASLLFDDLPAMDDAGLRRGRETAHLVYGEGVAILGGIGLLNGAYRLVAGCTAIPERARVGIADILGAAVGWDGLVRGQSLDLDGARKGDLVDIHDTKTGVLFEAAVEAGVLCAGVPLEQTSGLKDYARGFGRAYQAYDDLLDRYASADQTGKTAGRDGGKRTAVSVCGDDSDAARDTARGHMDAAITALGPAHRNSPLAQLAKGVEQHFMDMMSAS